MAVGEEAVEPVAACQQPVAGRGTVRAAAARRQRRRENDREGRNKTTRFEKDRCAAITDTPYVGGGTNYTSCRVEELAWEAAFADE